MSGMALLLAPMVPLYIFIFYGAGASQPTTVWVSPRGQGRELVPSPQGWAATAHFEQDLSSANWGARVRAIETIVARQGKQSVDDVLYALNDTNPNVRYSAFERANDQCAAARRYA
jgi:hypothetical protein